MTRYSVLFAVDATVAIEVEADSEDDAREKAEAQAGGVSLCHQCSDQLEVGDLQEIVGVQELADD